MSIQILDLGFFPLLYIGAESCFDLSVMLEVPACFANTKL
jgi:hypothetical protein